MNDKRTLAAAKVDGVANGGVVAWQNDLLNRRASAEYLLSFLKARLQQKAERAEVQAYVLNVDAEWGSGKTYFLQNMQLMLESQGYAVTYVDAWQDDHAEDPFLALVAGISETIEKLKIKQSIANKWRKNSEKLVPEIVELAGGIGKTALTFIATTVAGPIGTVVGSAVNDGLTYILKDKPSLTTFEASKKAIEDFRKNLQETIKAIGAVEGKQKTFFVLVDELDRCRPTYAIRLLERIKHLFNIDNMVFIIATNGDELKNSIKAVYGNDFNSGGYLHRFFNRTYKFPEPTQKQYINHLFQKYKLPEKHFSSPYSMDHVTFMNDAAKYYGLNLRDLDQCFDLLSIIHTQWPYKDKIAVELLLIIPEIVCFHRTGKINHKDFFIITSEWNFPYLIRRTDIWKKPNISNIPAKEIYNECLILLNENLYNIQRSGNERINWFAENLINERNLLHGNTYRPGSDMPSVHKKYTQMVLSAGELVTREPNKVEDDG